LENAVNVAPVAAPDTPPTVSKDAATSADFEEINVAIPTPTSRFSECIVNGKALFLTTTRPVATKVQLPRTLNNVQATSLISSLPFHTVTPEGPSLGPA